MREKENKLSRRKFLGLIGGALAGEVFLDGSGFGISTQELANIFRLLILKKSSSDNTPVPEKGEDIVLRIGDKKILIKEGRKNPNFLLFCSDQEFNEITGRPYNPEDYIGKIPPPRLTEEDILKSKAFLAVLRARRAGVMLPTKVDWSFLFPPAMRQSSGDCLAFTEAYKKSAQQRRQFYEILQTLGRINEWREEDIVSPQWYYMQREGEFGMEATEAGRITHKKGADSLAVCPYTGSSENTEPTELQLTWALPLRGKEVDWVFMRWPEIGNFGALEDLKQILAEKDFFVLIYRERSLVGGHAVTVTGYDDERGRFKFINSYGPEWGENGYGYISYEEILGERPDSIYATAVLKGGDRLDDCQVGFPEPVDFCPVAPTPEPQRHEIYLPSVSRSS